MVSLSDRRSVAPRVTLALLLLLAALHAWERAFLIDDAFISFRYARNLVEGHGLVYNVGERVEGYTNFLWTLMIAGAMRLGADPGAASQALGGLSALGTLLVLYRWGRDLGASPWTALLAPGMLAVNPSFAAWATGGLETRFFTSLVVAAAWRLHREREPGRLPVSAALVALACLTRPEGYLVALVALAGILLFRARAASYVATWCAVVGVTVLTHLLWRHGYYGEWLPNSFYAKVPGLRLVSGAVYLGAFAFNHAWPALVVLLLLALPRYDLSRLKALGRELSRFTLPFTFLFVVYTLAVGGDHFEFRFVDPVLVLLYFALGSAAALALSMPAAPIAEPVSHRLNRRSLAAGRQKAIYVLLVLSAVGFFSPFREVDRHVTAGGEDVYVAIASVESEAAYLDRWQRIGRWLKEHAAPDESIAVRPAGAIPYFSGLRALDMLGINDHDIARLPPRAGENVGHERQVEADYVVARGYTYLIASPEIRFERAKQVSPNAVEVSFGDFWWYFWPLQPGARIRPGSYRAP
jgi:arabinofuranosyltransferase